MNILLTNDDGYFAPGIIRLYETLIKEHDVLLVAPDREKSAVAHGISLNQPLRISKIDLPESGRGFTINGTPTDCIKLALFELCQSPPDLVISGINPGSNTGININYSGTVAAAREAVLNNIPAIAASIELSDQRHLDFTGMSQFVLSLIKKVDFTQIDTRTFLNINAPDLPLDQTKGVRITCQSDINISEAFVKRQDPKGRPYYWYGRVGKPDCEKNSDIHAMAEGYISISPIKCNVTSTREIDMLKTLEDYL